MGESWTRKNPSHTLSQNLQKVVGRSPGHMGLAALRCRIELQERVVECIVELHDGRLIATAVTVVGRREDGHHIVIVTPVEPFHDQLMSACHQREAIGVIERFRDVVTECVASTTRRYAPATAIIRVGPEEVAHGPFVGNLLQTIQCSNMIQCVDGRRETTVQAEYLLIHCEERENTTNQSIRLNHSSLLTQSGQRQEIEEIGKIFPHITGSIFAQTLIVEAVHLGDLTRLVIAAQNGYSVLVAHFKRNQQGDSLHTVVATIHIIAHEQVVGIGKATWKERKHIQIKLFR